MKPAALLPLAGLTLFLWAAPAFAICPTPPPVVQEYKHSEAVIIGTVESSRRVPQSWDTFDGTNFVVHVDQKVKGHKSGEIVIFSERTDNRFPLQVGTQYLLFLSNKYQHWEVNQCGNSSVLDDAGPVIKKLAHMMGND